jgi:hypothetical protein
MNNQSHTAISAATDTWVGEPLLREYLNMSSSTIRRLRSRGLPSLGRDRLRRYHLETVLQWLAENA